MGVNGTSLIDATTELLILQWMFCSTLHLSDGIQLSVLNTLRFIETFSHVMSLIGILLRIIMKSHWDFEIRFFITTHSLLTENENSHPFLVLKQKRKPNSTYLQKFDPRNMNNFHQNNSQKCWQYPGSATLQFHHQLKLLHWHGVVMIGEVYWFYCSCSARVQVRVQT